jgi:hypothetical protein
VNALRLELLRVAQQALRGRYPGGGAMGLGPTTSDRGNGLGRSPSVPSPGSANLSYAPTDESTTKANRLWLFEIERAIDEIQGGCPCSHTETVERFAAAYLAGGTA